MGSGQATREGTIMNSRARRTTAEAGIGPAAELTHELGNVLNGLLGMIRLMRQSNSNPRQALWLKAIDQSARQLQRLLCRVECNPCGTIEPRTASLDGIGLLEQVVLRHALAAEHHGNRMLLIVHPALPRAWRGDQALVQQVLDNLLGNAIKFTHGGEVLLQASPGQDRGSLLLEVSDTGPGITPGCERSIFAAGQRGGPGVADVTAGYGLGLYLCRRIVTAMRGDITCLSPASGGAVFRVQLPGLLEAEPSSPATRAPRLLHGLQCVLELDGSLRSSVSSWLERLGVASCMPGDIEAAGSSPCLRVHIRSVLDQGATPGPQLRLEARSPRLLRRELLRVKGPVIGSSLGPALLDLALRERSLSRGRRD